MRNRLLKSVLALAAVCVPALAMAQQPQDPIHREGSWEFSLGGGIMVLDPVLRDFLGSGAPETRFATSASPGRVPPTLVARVGYNFTPNWGLSASGGVAVASGVRYWTPTAALTYTVDLNARMSPFVLVGTELTRIEGDNNNKNRVTHSVWGAHAGLGVRQIIGEDLALRLEGRMQVEHYHEVPMRRSTVFNPVVTLGISFFVGGRRPPVAAAMAAAMAAAPACPACPPRALARVDTVRVFVPFPSPPPAVIVLRDTLILQGVNFAFDEAILTPESNDVLNRVAELLNEPRWRVARFEIAGHTSSIGTNEYNMGLSQRRAEAVRAYLFSRGVADNRMVPRGYGRTQPLLPEEREGDAWQNRRVELRRIW
jgi:outer membrane protein OmpA-like peptidoglycan-associated protein